MDTSFQYLALEEHFTSKAAGKEYEEASSVYGPAIGSRLISLGEARLADMDSGLVGRQVLSHTSFETAPTPELCAAINDELYTVVRAHPNRFSGFATLPMSNPRAAADEFKRAIQDLGFVGALVDTHTEGVFYDGPEWDVVWQTAQDLDVPFYIHPCYASEDMMRVNYRGNYSETIAKSLGAYVFGWHVETG